MYVTLGSKTVRILNYSPDFTPLIQKQLTYTLENDSESYDTTLVVWKEEYPEMLLKALGDEFNPKTNLKLRIEMLYNRNKSVPVWIFDKNYSAVNPVLKIEPDAGIIEGYDHTTNTCYYGVKNLDPEEFIKQGHIFVQIFNRIIKSETSNLVHGAVIGVKDKGILFCARGQRGKSTLAVLSMFEGFEYVSDDYLILEKENENLYSYPIYSIITLSPRMYNELYDRLDGCRFVSNNARKDKYVINIEKFHPRFRTKYPVKVCIFPEIVEDKEPSIRLCNSEEKGRAIVQLIQSTVMQMQDMNSRDVILKIYNMVKDFEFYKFNLCNNILENTRFLKDFMKNYTPEKSDVETPRMLVDITFGIANILDSETGTIFTMNKFATNIYENLINGVSPDTIISELEAKLSREFEFEKQVKNFVQALDEAGLLNQKVQNPNVRLNFDTAAEDKYKLSFLKYDTNKVIELTEEKEHELCVK